MKNIRKTSESKMLDIDVKMVAENGNSIIRARFTDRGSGIPPHVIEKVMNPFFSTKPKGKGTGLGLSISHGSSKTTEGN